MVGVAGRVARYMPGHPASHAVAILGAAQQRQRSYLSTARCTQQAGVLPKKSAAHSAMLLRKKEGVEASTTASTTAAE